jgi:hypothetical protein
MNHIETLQQEIRRLDGQVIQSLANYNAMLGAQIFAKQLLAKLQVPAAPVSNPPQSNNVNENATNQAVSSIAPM